MIMILKYVQLYIEKLSYDWLNINRYLEILLQSDVYIRSSSVISC